MGNLLGVYSFLEAEKKTWIYHNLQYDKSVREANLPILRHIKDGTDIYLAYTTNKWGGIEYQHWFVTDRKYFIEFGSQSVDIYRARVSINTDVPYTFSLESKNGTLTRKMDKDVRQRILHVLGISNYSLCLRNCEHVANYIFRGRWVSTQMDSDKGALMNKFRTYMMSNQIRLVNTFPSCIQPHIFNDESSTKLYSFITTHYVANGFQYYLDDKENTYNVLVLGPTGAGKSHLINVFFNQKICESDVSHSSVTQEIYFIRGRGTVYNHSEKRFEDREIVVADTIGLCDTEWDDNHIINLIKGRVSSNFKHIDAVYVVFRADRLLKDFVINIKMLLQWLQYQKGDNWLRFQFVGTYADYLDVAKKNSLRKEATKIFGLGQTHKFLYTKKFESLVYTGFQPEDTLNEVTKPRVEESWESLKMLLEVPGKTDRLSINNTYCVIL